MSFSCLSLLGLTWSGKKQKKLCVLAVQNEGGQVFLIGSWVNGLANIRQTLLDEINL